MEMNDEPVIIKKYPNRRLYDTSASRYVTLDEVAALVRQGREVRVVDSASGDDITRQVLTQIILEDSRDSEQGLPLELLRRMVAASDESMHRFLDWYLDTAMEGYRKASDAFREHLERAGGIARGPLDGLFDPTRMAPWLRRPDRDAGEVEKLRERLAELEQQLAELSERKGD
jgi:polyhydroxyalkanoate synthesis repressor PhaR